MFKYSAFTLKLFLIITTTIIISILALIAISDPLRIYKSPKPDNDIYIYNARVANLTIMKDHPFDSLIIGSSFSENTSAKEASELFDSKFLNISMSGAQQFENKLVLNYALNKYPIKNVIYTLGIWQLLSTEDNNELYPKENWAFLYDNNRLNDIKVYFNDNYFFKTLTFQKHDTKGYVHDMDRPYAWDTHISHTSRFGGFEKWIENKDNSQIIDVFNQIKKSDEINLKYPDKELQSKLKTSFLNNIFILAEQHPETNFYIILSPVSELELAHEMRTSSINNFENRIFVEKLLVSLAEDYPNVKIYGFLNESRFSKIEKYKDLTHFSSDFNSYFLQSIVKNKHQLTKDNIDAYHNSVRNIANNVDFSFYKNRILKETESK